MPFLIVSGTIGEETAVEALHAGANDFLIKGKLTRLGTAIARELREREGREAHKKAERALQESEARFLRLSESGVVGIMIAEASGAVVEANDTFLGMVGYTREDLRAGSVRWSDMTPPEWSSLNVTVGEQLRDQRGRAPVGEGILPQGRKPCVRARGRGHP